MEARGARLKRAAHAAVPIAFLGICFAWPLFAIVERGLYTAATGWHFGVVGDVLGDSEIRRVITFTSVQALLSTAAVLALGLPCAWLLWQRQFRGAGALRVAVAVPFVLPVLVVAAGFRSVLGPGGALAGLHWYPSLVAIVAAHVLFNVSVVARIVGAAWAGLDRRIADAARTLGASPWAVAREVTWPLLAPAIVGASLIVFLFCFTSFGTILVLGGLTRNTIETEIFRLTTEDLALDRAAVLVLVQLVAVVLVLTLTRRFERRVRGTASSRGEAAPVRVHGVGERVAAAVIVTALLALEVLPLSALVRDAARGGTRVWESLGAYSSVLGADPWASVRASLGIAIAACAIAVVVGLLAATVIVRRRDRVATLLGAAVLVPLGVSAVSVGYGFLVAFDRPIDLRSSWWLVPIAHATVALPFVVRAVLPVLDSVDPRVREAAAVLGASPRRVLREVDLPVIRRALAVGAGFAAAVSLGEFGATAFLARSSQPTIPIAIYRLLARPGAANRELAAVMALLLVALVAAAAALAERRRAHGAAW